MFCSNCGIENEAISGPCRSCGTELSGTKVEPTAAPSSNSEMTEINHREEETENARPLESAGVLYAGFWKRALRSRAI